jgi:glutaredoxin 3
VQSVTLSRHGFAVRNARSAPVRENRASQQFSASHAEAPDAMNPVRMFTTQVCPYCIRAKQLLKQRGVETIDEIRVDLDPAQRDTMIKTTGRRTVPQIFIGETWVGGCDDLVALDQKGGLMPLLGA